MRHWTAWADRQAAYLRGTLVLAGLLPVRDEELARGRATLQAQLAAVTDPGDRLILARFVRWRLLPYLNQLAERDRTRKSQTGQYVSSLFSTARMFLEYLRESGAGLADCPQQLADRWTAQNRWRSRNLRQFLAWATAHGLAPARLVVLDVLEARDRSAIDDDERILLALELEGSNAVALPNRVARLPGPSVRPAGRQGEQADHCRRPGSPVGARDPRAAARG